MPHLLTVLRQAHLHWDVCKLKLFHLLQWSSQQCHRKCSPKSTLPAEQNRAKVKRENLGNSRNLQTIIRVTASLNNNSNNNNHSKQTNKQTKSRLSLTLGSFVTMLKAWNTPSSCTPPPRSKKLAGVPPWSLIMSIVAIAKPAPFTDEQRKTYC